MELGGYYNQYVEPSLGAGKSGGIPDPRRRGRSLGAQRPVCSVIEAVCRPAAADGGEDARPGAGLKIWSKADQRVCEAEKRSQSSRSGADPRSTSRKALGLDSAIGGPSAIVSRGPDLRSDHRARRASDPDRGLAGRRLNAPFVADRLDRRGERPVDVHRLGGENAVLVLQSPHVAVSEQVLSARRRARRFTERTGCNTPRRSTPTRRIRPRCMPRSPALTIPDDLFDVPRRPGGP